MDRRQQAILGHLATYRVSTREVIEKHIVNNPERDLAELTKAKLITVHERALAGGKSAYQLSPKGAIEAGAPRSVGTTLKPQALIANLNLLWFCLQGDRRRYRVAPEELRPLLATNTAPQASEPNSNEKVSGRYYALEETAAGPRIYQVYSPSSTTTDRKIETALQDMVERLKKDSVLRELIDAQRFWIAVLVQSNERNLKLREFLKRPGRKNATPIPELIRVRVESVPDFVRSSGKIKGGKSGVDSDEESTSKPDESDQP